MHVRRPSAGWSSLILVTLMLLSVAWALEAQALNVEGFEILTAAVLGGVLTGVVLGSIDWLPASLAHGWSIVIAIVGATFLATFALTHYQDPAVLAELSVLDRMAIVRTSFFTWLRDVMAGSYPDRAMASFVLVFTMALLLWLISYVCVWFVIRYVSWWGAVLPSGFALLAVPQQDPVRSTIYLVFFLFCALLLAARTHLALQEDRWRRERVGFSSDSRFDVLRDGLVVATLVVAFGWLAPTDVAGGPLRNLMGRLSSANSQLNTQLTRWFPDVRVPVRGAGNSFGNTLPLGGSISLSKDPVFDARIDGGPVPRYFRMAVFDRYAGSTWLRQPNAVVDGDANQIDLAADYALTTPITQTIRPLTPNQLQLYAAPQAERFSLPVRASVADGPSPMGDVMSIESRAPLRVGENEYTVVSRASAADTDSLRSIDEADDPMWVRSRYLQVPDSVPERVRALAAQVVADSGASTRYDRANAIEDYLRQIPYSETIGQPPADQDRADWFLFDERRGYCDYYATSFVVMARSVGVPARFAAGYSAAGQPESTGAYRMRNSDAHTWPEVYFPDYGWVEFEPTAGDREIDRPQRVAEDGNRTPVATRPRPDADPTMEPDPADMNPDQPNGGPAAPVATDAGLGRLLARLALAAAGLAALVALAAFVWRRPLRGLSVAERAFAQFARLAGLVGLRPTQVETPYEYGARVTGAIPEAAGEIHTITDAYVRERFARRSPAEQAPLLAAAWARLRGTLLRGGLRRRVTAWRHRRR